MKSVLGASDSTNSDLITFPLFGHLHKALAEKEREYETNDLFRAKKLRGSRAGEM